jgi:very-short-patch-repair endonuclease
MRNLEEVCETERAMTRAELLLWTRIRGRQLGVRFRRHAPVGPHVADFVCFEKGLVVEIDDGRGAQSKDDRERDAYLAAHGFRVRRFAEHEVVLRPEAVVAALWLAIEGSHASAGRPHRWAGARPARTRNVGALRAVATGTPDGSRT